MVLVGMQRLLQPRLAPQREPRPGSGRITEVGDGELQQSARERVDRGSDDPTDLHGVRSRAHEGAHRLGQRAGRR